MALRRTRFKRRFAQKFQRGERVEVRLDGSWLPALYKKLLRGRLSARHVVLLDRARHNESSCGPYLSRFASLPNSRIRRPKRVSP